MLLNMSRVSEGEGGAPAAKRSAVSSIFSKWAANTTNVQSFVFEPPETWSDILTFFKEFDVEIVDLITEQLSSMQMKAVITLQAVMGKQNAATGEVMEASPYFRSKAAIILSSNDIRESLDAAYTTIEKKVRPPSMHACW